VCVCVCARVCVGACVCVHMYAHLCVCVYACKWSRKARTWSSLLSACCANASGNTPDSSLLCSVSTCRRGRPNSDPGNRPSKRLPSRRRCVRDTRPLPHVSGTLPVGTWIRHVTHTNESCHIWTGHVTQLIESCHIWTSHVTHMNGSCHAYELVVARMWMCCVTYEWVTSRVWMRRVTYEWVMSQIWMSHITHMNESCHTYEWVMSQIWMGHVTHMNESCHTYERVMPHIWTSHATHMNASCHTYESVMSHIYERVMPHIWMGHVTYMNKSCHTYEGVMSHIWMSVGSWQPQTHAYIIHECHASKWQSMWCIKVMYQCHVSKWSINVVCVYQCHVWKWCGVWKCHVSKWYIYVIYTYIPPPKMWHDSFVCVTWLIHMWYLYITARTLDSRPPKMWQIHKSRESRVNSRKCWQAHPTGDCRSDPFIRHVCMSCMNVMYECDVWTWQAHIPRHPTCHIYITLEGHFPNMQMSSPDRRLPLREMILRRPSADHASGSGPSKLLLPICSSLSDSSWPYPGGSAPERRFAVTSRRSRPEGVSEAIDSRVACICHIMYMSSCMYMSHHVYVTSCICHIMYMWNHVPATCWVAGCRYV